MAIAGLLGATGVGAAQAASSSDGRSSSAAQERAARDGGRGLYDRRLETIAGRLGVTSAQLKAALEPTAPCDRPARPATVATRSPPTWQARSAPTPPG